MNDLNEVLAVDERRRMTVKQVYRFIVFYHYKLIEVHKFQSDFSLIGRDLLARGASKAAEGFRSDLEPLAHVNYTAP
ncbi:hypothetical protein PILCRDRAFT_3445 [Piloderma croceum F 1598]|uniref:HAM1-like N-terminal domain-containing protein n=1 Tax=Piloderma croceum (strain F 1598) TaxID=765440 RepID=A0A0C3BPN0_PILCF|nr:hypothetical protein PILCRDRAFT_3445 [Piloderma croceum F 1598]